MSLALALSQHPHVCALHESQRGLIKLSFEKLAGEGVGLPERRAEVVNFFRVMVPQPAGVQMCGLVDQKLSAFIPELAEAWPGGKFVWLVRDGRGVVASGYERGWYQPAERDRVDNAWARWRWRGDVVGDMTAEEWGELGAFGRNCWYWAWVNGMIRRELVECVAAREMEFYMVRLEDLGVAVGYGSAAEPRYKELERLVEWLGLQPAPGMAMVRANAGPGRRRWETWSEEQRAVFGELCGEMMGELGYGLSG
ncbi:MAG: sulfotransferase [Akkermansiaceae bacterium]|nr:sulfotransferase [Akkermansiaceae bacterium]